MSRGNAPVLITGGAGFIGCNLAAHLARSGRRVRIYDDLSRTGVDRNLAWLQRKYGDRIEASIADIRDRARLRDAVSGVDAVFHLSAQVAGTTSFVDPHHDFSVNATGTLELLEAIRERAVRPPLVFTSTKQVYGSLSELPLTDTGTRWQPVSPEIAARGIDESRHVQPRTPHGCSKGCADQYVLDYAQSYGIPATVFRMSCVYGPHQFGTEHHGWISYFLTRALEGKPIHVYGDGKQVRDMLFIDDLVDAFVRAWSRIGLLAGRAFNIGGGPTTAMSVRELLQMVETLRGCPTEVTYEPWRSGDQRYYVSDTTAFREATGWAPRALPGTGIGTLYGWLVDEHRPARVEAAHV